MEASKTLAIMPKLLLNAKWPLINLVQSIFMTLWPSTAGIYLSPTGLISGLQRDSKCFSTASLLV